MSKLDNLYYLFHKNVISIFLLSLITIPFSLYSQESKADNIIKKIVIDAGHGGKDPGTMGTKRYNKYEKHVALAVSLKLGDYISTSFSDIEVIYTRKSDVFLALNERTELANNAEADLFISIHCDGFTNSKASGASVFVMGTSKLKENMDIAMRENSVIYLEDNYQEKYEGFDPNSPESYIVFSLMQNTYLDQSLQLAEAVEKEFSNRANRKSRGVKQAPFYVISRTNMPSILIECGFLTNPKEEDFLHSEKGQDHLASAIFEAFKNYKETVEGLHVQTVDKNSLDSEQKNKKTIMDDNSISKDNRVVYKVQIGTYLESMLGDKLFQDIKAEEQIIHDTYKYFVGYHEEKKEIDKLKEQMKEKGFKGAFVIAFYQGSQISTKEALDLQKKLINYE